MKSVDTIVKDLGVKIYKYDNAHENFTIRCPMPNHIDRHPSCSVHLKTGVWRCLSCNASGDLVALVALLAGEDRSDVLKRLGGSTNPIKVLKSSVRLLSESKDDTYSGFVRPKQIPLPDEYERITKGMWKKSKNVYVLYLKSRSISYDIVKKFKIGYCDDGYYKYRIIIPVLMNNICYGFIARKTVGTNKGKKYLYAKGMTVGGILLNTGEIKHHKEVYIAEGAFDIFAFYRTHIKNVVAIMGLNISPSQIRLLLMAGVERLIFAVDRDVDGESLDKLYGATYEYFDLYRVKPTGKDFGEMKSIDIEHCLKYPKRVKYRSETVKKLKSPGSERG